MKNNEWKQKRRKLLNDIASKMYSTTNRSKVLQIIVEHIQTIYPNVKYDILLSQDYEPVNCRMPIKELQLSGDVNNASDKAFLTGKIQMKRHGNSTFLYAPLTGHQGVYGVIRTQALNCKKIPQNEIDFIKEFADIAGQALENVMLYQSSITLVSNLQLINKATHQLNKNVNLAELTTTIKQYIKNASKAQEIGIFYLDQEKNTELRIAQESTSFFQSKAGSTLANLLMDDIKEKPEIFSGNFTSYYPNFRYESLMFIPMTQSGETFGGIVVLHEEKFYFPFENFKLMQSLIQHYTLAVTNTFLKERLKEAVITDYLTKLYARNHLDAMIKEDMETGMFGTFILFDIDDFKRINDTYGHFIGDEVIIQIADIVKTNTSEKDVPAR